MYIEFGNRRINFSVVKEYKPIDISTLGKPSYHIRLTFINDTTDELHFFEKKDDRDEYIKKLDENLLTPLP